jgi:hypothetical protein
MRFLLCFAVLSGLLGCVRTTEETNARLPDLTATLPSGALQAARCLKPRIEQQTRLNFILSEASDGADLFRMEGGILVAVIALKVKEGGTVATLRTAPNYFNSIMESGFRSGIASCNGKLI